MGKKYKSAETIVESDVEGDAPTEKHSSQPKSQSKPSASKSSPSKPAKRKATPPPETPSKRAKSTPKPPKSAKFAPKPPTPPAASSATTSKDEESEPAHAQSDNESGPEKDDAQNVDAASVTSAESERSKRVERANPSGTTKPPKAKSIHEPSDATTPASSSFEPPAGFEHLKSDIASHPISDLAGKQLFQITCPASVPLTHIKELSLRQLQKGDRISHNGSTYFFRTQFGTNAEARVLEPTSDGKYRAAKRKFDKTMSLQEDLLNSADMDVPHQPVTKPVVQQPEGLQARHFPAGFEPKPAPKATSPKRFKPPPKHDKPRADSQSHQKTDADVEQYFSASDTSSSPEGTDNDGKRSKLGQQSKKPNGKQVNGAKKISKRKSSPSSSSESSSSDESSHAESISKTPAARSNGSKPNGAKKPSKHKSSASSSSESSSSEVSSDDDDGSISKRQDARSQVPKPSGAKKPSKRKSSPSSSSSSSSSDESSSDDSDAKKQALRSKAQRPNGISKASRKTAGSSKSPHPSDFDGISDVDGKRPRTIREPRSSKRRPTNGVPPSSTLKATTTRKPSTSESDSSDDDSADSLHAIKASKLTKNLSNGTPASKPKAPVTQPKTTPKAAESSSDESSSDGESDSSMELRKPRVSLSFGEMFPGRER